MPPARKPPPGNPLWIEWLKEWEKEVTGKSEHMPKIIRKAIKSFEQCPVPIEHPSNANALRNVGPAMTKYLTKRLNAYCQENGLEVPRATVTTFEKEAAKVNKKKRKNGDAADNDDEGGPVASGSGVGAAGSGSEAEVNTSPMKKPRKPRLYVPKVKSGPWAILIGLASYGTGEWKSQDAIIEAADPFYGEEGQSLKDKSTGGGAGAQFYTGWSSSKTLFTKELIEKRSRNPVLYQITYKGWKIARKAVRNAKRNNDIEFEARRALPDFETEDEQSEDDENDAENHAPAPAAKKAAAAKSTDKGKGRAVGSSTTSAALRTVEIPSFSTARRTSEGPAISPNDPAAPFLFYYLTDDNERVARRDDAEVNMCPMTFTTLHRIEFRQSQAKHIFVIKNVTGPHVPIFRDGPLGPEGSTFSAYLNVKFALDPCPTFNSLITASKPPVAAASSSPKRGQSSQATTSKAPAAAAAPKPKAPKRSDTAEIPAHNASRLATFTVASTSTATRPPQPRASSPPIIDLDDEPLLTIREKRIRAAEARTGQPSTSSPAKVDVKGKGKATLPNAFDIMQAASKAASASNLPAIQMTVTAEGNHIPDIDEIRCTTWAPKDYDIELVIDSREKPGLSSKRIEKMLTERGIKWSTATLAMADAIWVAKNKKTGDEVVLDACLERKRLDDLLSSMRDGRYMEQKNRMVKSGMSKLIYLVEEHDTKKAMETWGRQIWTMKSSLQMVDDFTVHIAWDVTDACNYLARLTKAFVEIYQNTTLTILPDACLHQFYHLPFMRYLQKERPNTSYVYSMASFAALNCKQHSVHTGWAKTVASINQMSLSSTERFLKKWPAPAIFFEELDKTIENDKQAQRKLEEEKALDPYANKRKKKDNPKVGECWIMRETSTQIDGGDPIRPIGEALSTHCWKLFTAEKY